MERAISVEERIRRAEERYNRKMGQRYFEDNSNISINEKPEKASKKKKSKRKLIMYILVCLVIYICFYAVSNRDYIFSEEFKKDVNSFFTEKTKLYAIYSDIKSYVQNNILKNTSGEEQTSSETQNENVGGAEEIVESEKENAQTEEKEKTQMEKDADEIKSKIGFINPIEGRISSTFGWRNPTNPNVPKYHTGLDIAAATGTVIKSATDGTVEIVSDKGDYGNHYYIKNDNVTIIYAHCSKLYLKEGDTVKQGQEIAEVGSTGNSTGPHLHIGIKLDDRWVDPQLILNI